MESVGAVIIGGGITGVTVARLLQRSGFEDCVILEQAPEPGGLCRTQNIDGHVLDVGGGHLLCSRHPEVYEFIFAHLPESAFRSFARVSRVLIDGCEVDYPVEYNLWQLPEAERREYLRSCAEAGECAGERQPTNFSEWVRWKLGERIAERYMIPYNEKVWGVAPHELDIDWLEKIPKFDLARVFGTCLDRDGNRASMPSHESFYYPKHGGFQAIFDAILAPVASKLRVATPLRRLARRNRQWIVNDSLRTPLVINTIPWPKLHATVEGGPALEGSLARIQTSGLVVSLHQEAFETNAHWLYIGARDVAHHRNFYIPNFAPHSKPHGLFRETNVRRYVSTPNALFAHCNHAAYPIPLVGHASAAETVWRAYSERGVIGVGRWGQHRYYNADVCIREAMGLVDRLSRGADAADVAPNATGGAPSLR